MFGRETKLQKALRAYAERGVPLADLVEFGTQPKGLADVEALRDFLKTFQPPGQRKIRSDLSVMLALLQQPANKETGLQLDQVVLPELERVYDAALERGNVSPSDLVFALKIMVLYGRDGSLARIANAARRFPDEYMWSVIFDLLGERHPRPEELIALLRDSLPEGFAAVAFLDFANTVARRGTRPHAFDTAAGLERLRDWLIDPDSDHESYAVSATAALPFLGADLKPSLMALARQHRSLAVRMESSWALAKSGDENGLDELVKLCADPRTAGRPMKYLEELGHENRIPIASKSEDFSALVEMVSWLEHPNEFGEPPDDVAIADTRILHWPPTADERRLWVIRYRYAPRKDRPEDVGFGMVGSVTFALFGEATADLSPLEVYGLHCCWELEGNEDRRAPAERSAVAGLTILKKFNADLGRA